MYRLCPKARHDNLTEIVNIQQMINKMIGKKEKRATCDGCPLSVYVSFSIFPALLTAYLYQGGNLYVQVCRNAYTQFIRVGHGYALMRDI